MSDEEKDDIRKKQGHLYEESIQNVDLWKSEFYNDLYSDNEQIIDGDMKTYATFYSC